jgi:hypothetical protein
VGEKGIYVGAVFVLYFLEQVEVQAFSIVGDLKLVEILSFATSLLF